MSTELYAVIGDPIEHSISPALQTAAFQSAGIDASYEAHRVPPGDLAAHVESLRRRCRGFNVTIPHKEAIVRYMVELDAQAQTLGAVNTVVVSGGRLIGHNTDPAGFLVGLEAAGFDPAGATVVVFGAGGAARAVAYALRESAASLMVVGRNEERALEAAKLFGAGADRDGATVPTMSGRGWSDSGRAEGLIAALAAADLVINATPLGMEPRVEQSPLPPGAQLNPTGLAYDLVYGRATPFLRTAAAHGCRTVDGLEMLVGQGAAAFRLWTGMEPNADAMRQACRLELEERLCSAS